MTDEHLDDPAETLPTSEPRCAICREPITEGGDGFQHRDNLTADLDHRARSEPSAESDGVDDRTYDEPEPDPAYVPPLIEDDDGDPA